MDTTVHNNIFSKHDVTKMYKKTRIYAEFLSSVISSKKYEHPESALYVAGDVSYQRKIKKSLARFSTVKHVVLIGIGGSSLGTEAVYHALKKPDSPTLTVLDTLSTDALDVFQNLLKKTKKPEHIAVVIVSKSGTTTETIWNAGIAISMLKQKFSETYTERVMVISDTGSDLLMRAKKQKILTFTIPQSIGGRYSVFTAVGIVPLTLLGIDVTALCAGAKSALLPDTLIAQGERFAILGLYAQSGYHTYNFFTFEQRLSAFGYWYRQLLAESFGKPTTRNGKKFTHQLLPIVSTSIDLHSVTQLYLGGYTNIITRFFVTEKRSNYMLPDTWITEHLSFLSGTELANVSSYISQSVLKTYDDQSLPYFKTSLTHIDAFTVGNLLATCMVEVMHICNLFEVNAFDQPNVESYKKYVRDALNS